MWFEAIARTRTTPQGELVYRWEFGDGGGGVGAEAEHTYAEPGTYTATVTVTDAAGRTGTRRGRRSRSPTRRATARRRSRPAAARASGKAPLDVLLTAQGADPDGDALTYAGSSATASTADGPPRAHTYTSVRHVPAKVTVSDGAA